MADRHLKASKKLEHAQTRLSTPLPEQSFQELTDALPLRPRYLGPGRWKKLLIGMPATEESLGD